MNKFREEPPIKQTVSTVVSKYQNHRPILKKNFRGKCGYCNDNDFWRNTYYEIDHYIPKKYLTEAEEKEYWNLIYSCRYCNNSKRAKWPTKDRNIENNGKEGFVNPYSKEYDLLFERDNEGRIIPQSELAKWIYKNLNLGLKRHSIIWQLECLKSTVNEIREFYKTKKTIDPKTKLLLEYISHIENLMNNR